MNTIVKILLPLCLLSPLPLMAQQYSEQSLKTLFTTPQQRQSLDSEKRTSSAAENQPMAGPATVQVNGIVKRSDGKNVVWVNGKSTIDNATVDSIKVYAGSINSRNKVPVMIDGRKVYLKPGETWSEEAGISDANQ